MNEILKILGIALQNVITVSFIASFFKLVCDRILETSIEKSLQTNWQRALQIVFDYFWTFCLFIMLSIEVLYIIFKDDIDAVAGEDSIKDSKSSEIYAFIMLFILLLVLWAAIYGTYRTFMKSNFEQKHYLKKTIDGQEKKLVILKKVKKDRILCSLDSSSTTNDIIYIFLPIEEMDNEQIYKYSITDVRNRRYERVYLQFKDAFQNKVATVITSIVILGIMGVMGFVSGQPITIAIEVIVIFGIFITYYSFNYRKGKELQSEKEEKISNEQQDLPTQS
ncbi:hypothetical protein JZO78_03810 [Enterococcus ureilyticus]|uniref:hypothetical protein n=1 Tax=Enterococcus ureilyticus TaxID=1131292 RepID=UPI001A932124|nr:hypothetical protein [Enterococcus ureilyticus]MBO0445461.1 hypothetical protein [Enterococcus ureilyticus]